MVDYTLTQDALFGWNEFHHYNLFLFVTLEYLIFIVALGMQTGNNPDIHDGLHLVETKSSYSNEFFRAFYL